MDAKVILDISSIVWDETHFNSNKDVYYTLKSEVFLFLNAFEKCSNLKFVAREELLNEIQTLFPYSICKDHSMFDFQRLVLQFLATKRTVSYSAISSTTNIIPNICYPYFSTDLQTEIGYLVTEIHNSPNEHTFCTFRTCWGNNFDLQTNNGTLKTHKTIIHEGTKPTIQDYYFSNIRNIFEHNSKHDSNKHIHYDVRGNKINPLSCYDERAKDPTIPQELLDLSIQYGNERYYYDYKVKHSFVCFKLHSDRKYHGYDLYDKDITDNTLRIVLQKIKEDLHK